VIDAAGVPRPYLDRAREGLIRLYQCVGIAIEWREGVPQTFRILSVFKT
jgi:hypothetical protein